VILASIKPVGIPGRQDNERRDSMGTKNSPLHKLFQKLIAEEKIDPILAKKLLDEILRIITGHREK